MRAAAVPLVCCLLAGCAERTLMIESDTSWSGNVQQVGAINGQGGAELELPSTGGRLCWDLQKGTTAGTLRAYVRDKKNFFGTDTDGDMATTEPNGLITGCTG
jgi:hypothetical protein